MKKFENFPKQRIVLPIEFEKIYKTQYLNNRSGNSPASSLSQKIESWLHKKVALDTIKNTNLSTLEIGAGTLNQLKYEKASECYDIIEPMQHLYQNSDYLSKIRNIYSDISEINGLKIYDRIISVATFEHILDLPFVVAKTCFLLKPNGKLRVSIPNEGSFIFKLGWQLTTGLEFWIKHKLRYSVLIKYEHVSTADEIEQVLKFFYNKTTCKKLGLSKKISLYRFYECSNPIFENATEYLNSLSIQNNQVS